MKEIKAYVRASMATHVIRALADEGCLDFSIVEVRGISGGLPREAYHYSMELGEGFERIVKFEIICRDANAGALANVIRQAAATGRKGDGMVFVAAIEEAIRIRDAQRGEGVLGK